MARREDEMTEHTKLQLSPAEHRIAVLLARGIPRKQIAKRLRLSRHTVNGHVAGMRRKTGSQCGSLPALVHVLLVCGLIPTPRPRRAAPDLAAGHRSLLEALVHEHNRDAVARKIGLSLVAVRQKIQLLCTVTGARTAEHLVALAHGWQLLGARQHATGCVPSAVALPSLTDRHSAATMTGTGSVKVPASRATPLLTPTERRIATFLVQGVEVRDIGPRAGKTVDAVKGTLKAVRRKFGCPGCSQAVLAYRLLSSGSLVPPPAPSTTPPSLSTEEKRLLIAVATLSTRREIGESLGFGGIDTVKRRVGHLLTATDSEHPLDLVVRAYGWNLFDASSGENTEARGAVSRFEDRAAHAPFV
ncbi:helix-turn-helix transcriptional regulator [Streptomyces sp. NPDC046860]|uniref:helix-turn-helix transcriptional regulator n=1 Tax=Streptomyces sp. NPDC046860 TaxID=3154495 RepID=UPI0033E32B1A